MYVGGTGSTGLHHLVWELVGNVIDQHLAGYATELRVELADDGWVTVSDDGPGIPTDTVSPIVARRRPAEDPRKPEPTTVIETVFTRLHQGPTWAGHYPHVHVAPSLIGFGCAVASALSERLVVDTSYRGVHWRLELERGERVSPLRRLGRPERDGTTIRFRPDPTIFSTVVLDHAVVHARLQELAWLNPHLRVFFQDERIAARGGVCGLAGQLASARDEVLAVHTIAQNVGDVRVDIGLAWNRDGESIVRSFVNLHPTLDGSHVDALWLGFADYARSSGAAVRTAREMRQALGTGLVAVVSIGLHGAEFASPTKDILKSPRARKAVRAAIASSWRAELAHIACVKKLVHERLQPGKGPTRGARRSHLKLV
jgi:DNA gyrase/topoisomerase IV subunit B